jgi:hypothetical protein
VLAQAGGQQVALVIASGTAIQRGEQRVHLEELGIGNYVMVQAVLLRTPVPREGTVGSSPGERAITLEESARE